MELDTFLPSFIGFSARNADDTFPLLSSPPAADFISLRTSNRSTIATGSPYPLPNYVFGK